MSVFILTAALVASIIITFGKDKTSSAVNFASNLVAGDKVSIPENPNWQDELGVIGDIKVPEEETGTTTEETTTDVMSRTLMANYLAMRESGTLDNTSAQKLIDQTLAYVENTEGQIKMSQLNIVADNGKQSIKEYGENLGDISQKNKLVGVEAEIKIITKAIESQNPSQIKELDSIIYTYKKIAGELIRMPVPETFLKAHLDLTNGVNNIATSLEKIKESVNDPIVGLSALQIYVKNITLLSQVRKAIVDFIIKNNVVYEQGSGGYYLLYGI